MCFPFGSGHKQTLCIPENNPPQLEWSPVSFRSCCDYHTHQIPLASFWNELVEQKKSPKGSLRRIYKEDPVETRTSSYKFMHLFTFWAAHHALPPLFRLSVSLRGPAGPCRSPRQQTKCCWKPNSVREYWIIFPPLLWAVGGEINLVLVKSSRSRCRRYSRIIRASLCMFCFSFCLAFCALFCLCVFVPASCRQISIYHTCD